MLPSLKLWLVFFVTLILGIFLNVIFAMVGKRTLYGIWDMGPILRNRIPQILFHLEFLPQKGCWAHKGNSRPRRGKDSASLALPSLGKRTIREELHIME